jgi:hypothetical protein
MGSVRDVIIVVSAWRSRLSAALRVNFRITPVDRWRPTRFVASEGTTQPESETRFGYQRYPLSSVRCRSVYALCSERQVVHFATRVPRLIGPSTPMTSMLVSWGLAG